MVPSTSPPSTDTTERQEREPAGGRAGGKAARRRAEEWRWLAAAYGDQVQEATVRAASNAPGARLRRLLADAPGVTAGDKLGGAAMMRRRIYISGPLTSSGSVLDNLARAMDAARALIAAGFAPFCPHLTYHVDPGGEYPHDLWMEIELPWVAVADALLRLPGESLGADLEVARAEALGIPVFTSVADLAAHFTVN